MNLHYTAFYQSECGDVGGGGNENGRGMFVMEAERNLMSQSKTDRDGVINMHNGGQQE